MASTTARLLVLTSLLLVINRVTGNTVISVQSKVLPCSSSLANNDWPVYTNVIKQQREKNKFECLKACYRHELCSSALLVDDGEAEPLCVLLGGINTNPLQEIATPPSAWVTCHVLLMNPCQNGGTFSRGFCECPEGFTGIHCEKQNPADCYNRWTEIYGVNVPDGDTTVNDVALGPKGGYLKIKIDNPDDTGSDFMLHGRKLVTSDGAFSLQMTPFMSKQAWNALDAKPALRFFMVEQYGLGGRWKNFTEDNPGVDSTQKTGHWYARMPHQKRLIYAHDSTGNATSGTVDDVITALENGYEIIANDAIFFDRASKEVISNKLNWYFQQPAVDFVVEPPQWVEEKFSVTGRKSTQRYDIYIGWPFSLPESSNEGGELHVDVCWTRATTDRMGNGKAVTHLMGAILNGHRVRVIVDNMALTVHSASIYEGKHVGFRLQPFIKPENKVEISPGETWMASFMGAVTDGTIYRCSTNMPGGPGVQNNTYVGNVTWFVDTRVWSRVYSIQIGGTVLFGTEAELVAALKNGASLQVGLTSDGANNLYDLYTIQTMELTWDGHVTAQVQGLFNSVYTCAQRAMLFTSLGTVEQYNYVHKQQGTHKTISLGVLDWFVQY